MKEGGILDLDLDEFQLLGTVPVAVVDVLWPGFVPQSYDVYINPVYLRRHLQSRPDYVNRVAALNHYGHLLESCIARASAYGRYDHVPPGEAGLNLFSRAEAELEPAYLQLGIRLLPRRREHQRLNHVSTLLVVRTVRYRAVLLAAPHCLADGRVDN
jgi:hypothetical protein